MKRETMAALFCLLAGAMTFSGAASAAAVLSVEPASGPIQTPLVVTGSGFEPMANVDIFWTTEEGNRVSGSGFKEVRWQVGTAQADASGALHYEFAAPPDLGGPPHSVLAVSGDTVLAWDSFTITRTARITPTSGPLGTTIELHLTGGGWTQYDNIVAVTYDNAYIGYMCSFNSQGNMTTWFPASGGVGKHVIDVWPALYYGPSDGPAPWKLPHLSEGDKPWQPPIFHFEFEITDMNGSVPLSAAAAPPAASGDDAWPAVLVAGALLFLVASGLEWPIRRAGQRARAAPAAAAAVLLIVGLVAAAGGAVQASETGAPGPAITPLSTGAGPTVGLSAGTARPGEVITVSGAGMPANQPVELRWGTVHVQNRSSGEKFLGWNVTPDEWLLATLTTDSAGAFSRSIATPFDYQGPHDVRVTAGSVPLAATSLQVVPYFEIAGPTHVKAGEKVTVRGYGLGYEKYSASWNVVYDNRLTGWVSGLESHGNVTFSLYAVGEPGQHFIDIGEGAVGFPYLNLWESPFQNRPPGHLSFVIDAEQEEAARPPPAGPSVGPGAFVAGAAFAGAAAVVSVQVVRWRGALRASAPAPKGR